MPLTQPRGHAEQGIVHASLEYGEKSRPEMYMCESLVTVTHQGSISQFESQDQ